MSSIVNVRFKVTRVDHEGNQRDTYFRIFVLDSVDLEQKGHLYNCYPSSTRFSNIIVKIKKEFPGTNGIPQSNTLVSPDSEGDHILVETINDLHAIIQMNKKKCMAGESIRLYVVDLSHTITSANVIKPTDSNKMTEQSTNITQQLTDSGQIEKDVSFENKMTIKLSEQDAENKRLLKTLQLGQENIAKQLLAIISDQNKKDYNQEDDTASITASLKRLETKMKEQNVKFDQIPANLLGILNESRPNEYTKELATPEKIASQREVVFVEEQPKQDSVTSNPLKSSSSIESLLNKEEESSADINKSLVVLEVDEPVAETSTIKLPTVHQEEDSSATIPLMTCDIIENHPTSTVLPEDATEREIQEEGEDDDGASVKSDSSISSAGSVWVMEDMVKSTASIQEPLYSKDEPRHHSDALVDAALEKMLAMGFKNEGGWLTRLLEVKKGDINQALNVLHLS